MNKKNVIALIYAALLVGGVSLARALSPVRPALVLDPQKTAGPLDAETFMVGFIDFNCEYCDELRPTITELRQRFPQVKFVFKHFPGKFQKNARAAAEASECAAEQGRFWPYYDLLFDENERWDELAEPKPMFVQLARRGGLDVKRFSQCLETGAGSARVSADMEEAARFRLRRTPTLLINGRTNPPTHDVDDLAGILQSLAGRETR